MAGILSTPSVEPARSTSRPNRGVSHVRTLLWLAWTLRLRGYTRSWQQALGLGVSLLFFILPIGVLLGFGTAAGYVLLPREAATQLLFAVLLVLYVAWAALPLLQYTVNEGLDVTKLQIYPVTRSEQMLTLILATLFDLTGLIILGAFAGILVGWQASAAPGSALSITRLTIWAVNEQAVLTSTKKMIEISR